MVDRNSAVTAFRSQVDANVLSAWLGCIETTNAQGLKAGIRPIGKNTIYFWLRYIPAGLNDTPHIKSIQLAGLKPSDNLKVNDAITSSNGGIGSFYEVSGTDSVVAVNITTKNPDRGGIEAHYDYGNHEADVTQRQVNQALVTAGYVVGEIRSFAGPSIPKALQSVGWMECDGRDLQIDQYKALHDVIGGTWGSRVPGITFNLPDLRGYFLRGWSHGSGHDPEASGRGQLNVNGSSGDNVGSFQNSAVGPHDHKTNIPNFQSFSQGDSGGGSHAGIVSGYFTTNTSEGKESRPANVDVIYMIYTGVPQP